MKSESISLLDSGGKPMSISNIGYFSKLILSLLSTVVYSAAANAIPITAKISIASNYTVVHNGSNPGGTGDPADWLWLDSGQFIELNLINNLLTLDGLGPQTFTLRSGNGTHSTMDIVALHMDLNDVDGFRSGYLNYILNGTEGTFSFVNQNYGTSVFNKSVLVGDLFEMFVWGGDETNQLGIDFAISARTTASDIPEPNIWFLMLSGFGALVLARRKKVRQSLRQTTLSLLWWSRRSNAVRIFKL